MPVVLRDGKWEQVNARELVIGDIVDEKSGDRIPGDIRILSANSFKVWINTNLEMNFLIA